MDLELSDEDAELRDNVRAVLAGICPPSVPRQVFDGDEPDAALWARLVEVGWPALAIDERHGGLGIIARSLFDYGNEVQIRDYALPVLRDKKSACLGMSEPGAGSDLAAFGAWWQRRRTGADKAFCKEALRRAALVGTELAADAGADVGDPDHMRGPDCTWIEQYFASFGGTISAGSSEIQRNIIAERVLGLPKG